MESDLLYSTHQKNVYNAEFNETFLHDKQMIITSDDILSFYQHALYTLDQSNTSSSNDTSRFTFNDMIGCSFDSKFFDINNQHYNKHDGQHSDRQDRRDRQHGDRRDRRHYDNK